MDSGLCTAVKLGIFFFSSPCSKMENKTYFTSEKNPRPVRTSRRKFLQPNIFLYLERHKSKYITEQPLHYFRGGGTLSFPEIIQHALHCSFKSNLHCSIGQFPFTGLIKHQSHFLNTCLMNYMIYNKTQGLLMLLLP